MGKRDAWDDVKEKAVEGFLSDENLDALKIYDPDVIFGRQPYVSAFALALSMGPKLVDISSIPSPDVDLDYLENKRVLVFSDDPHDDEAARDAIERFGISISSLGDFRYAVGNPLRMFTFEELRREYGSNEDSGP